MILEVTKKSIIFAIITIKNHQAISLYFISIPVAHNINKKSAKTSRKLPKLETDLKYLAILPSIKSVTHIAKKSLLDK